MRLRIDGTKPVQVQAFLLANRERDPYFARDRAGHFSLQGQDVVRFSLIALGPEMGLIAHADKLGGNAHTAAFAAGAALENIICS